MSRFFKSLADSESDTEDSEEELLTSGDDEPVVPAQKAPVRGMARFLKKKPGESASSDSSDESGDDSEDEAPKPAKKLPPWKGGPDEDSDEDERGPVVIVSARNKRLIEMEATGKSIENAQKINDWVVVSTGLSPVFNLCTYC